MQRIIIAHQYYCPEHFLALIKSKEFEVDYKIIDPLFYLYRLLKMRNGLFKHLRLISLALLNITTLNFVREKQIIFALPPYLFGHKRPVQFEKYNHCLLQRPVLDKWDAV